LNPRQHHDNVRALGCCLSHTDQGVTIHHCHGRSIIEWFGGHQNPGMGQRQNDYLVIPLAAEYHVGNFGIDYGTGVRVWELCFGPQVYWLTWVNAKLEYDLFDLAGVPNPGEFDWDFHDRISPMRLLA
jgi:hypothetical protein